MATQTLHQRNMTGMAMSLGKLHVYAGTVPAAVKAARRTRNKAARIARRHNR